MRARGTHNDTTTPASDSGSTFSFTPVNIAPFGDHSEHLCPRTMSYIVSTDQVPLDTVSSHRCCRPGMNLISEMGVPIRVVSLFGVEGKFVSQSIGVTRAMQSSVVRPQQ